MPFVSPVAPDQVIRYATLVAITFLVSACTLLSPRIDGVRVDFRVSAVGRSLGEIAFFIPVKGRLTHIQVLHPTSTGGREVVWSSNGAAVIASLSAHGFRDSIGYGLDYEGLVPDALPRPLADAEIYVVYVTVINESGKELRGGTVFIASEREGVDYGCDSVEECSSYLLSTIT